MKKRTRMFTFGVMEWSNSLDLAMYLNYYPVLCCLGKHFQGTTMKNSTVKAPEWNKGGIKHAIFRKINSGQLAVYSPLELSEAVTKFVPPNHSLYLTQNENIVEPEDINKARKIDQILKIHKLERKCSHNGDTYINFYKTADDPFHVQWHGGENEIICGHVETSESNDECAKGSYNEGEEWLCCPACHQSYHEDCFYE